jgi:hypothetical protein
MKKSTLLISTGIATGAFVIGLTFSNPFASADQNGLWERGKGFSPEAKAKISEAIEKGDYANWKSLTDGKGRMGETITEENFPLLKELHNANQSGDTAKAEEIRKQLGLPESKAFKGKGGHRGHGMMIDPETRIQIDQAIEKGDYATWKSLTDGKGRMGETITEENFPLLKELHNANQSGDNAKAEEIRKQLGLTLFERGKGKHHQRNNSAN